MIAKMIIFVEVSINRILACWYP